MKKLILGFVGVLLVLGGSLTTTYAEEPAILMANYIKVDECTSNDLLKYLRLDSVMKFSTQTEGVDLVELSYTINEKKIIVEDHEKSYDEQYQRFVFEYSVNVCNDFESNLTNEQVEKIKEYNDELDVLYTSMNDLKENHYDEDTRKFDTEENEQLYSKYRNSVASIKNIFRSEYINSFFKYELLFENNLRQEYTFKYSSDFDGVSFVGSPILMDFKDKKTNEENPEEVVKPEEEKNEEKDKDKDKEESLINDPSYKTPNTGVSTYAPLYISLILLLTVFCSRLSRRRNYFR